MPSSSWERASSESSAMSYQARITMPPLIVTGRVGACGKTKRTGVPAGRPSSGTMG